MCDIGKLIFEIHRSIADLHPFTRRTIELIYASYDFNLIYDFYLNVNYLHLLNDYYRRYRLPQLPFYRDRKLYDCGAENPELSAADRGGRELAQKFAH